MRIRSELTLLSQSITNYAANWNGQEEINLRAPATKNASHELHSIGELAEYTLLRINKYVQKDASLQGKIDTLSLISSSFKSLIHTSRQMKPWHARIASYLFIFRTPEEQTIHASIHSINTLLTTYKNKKYYAYHGKSLFLQFISLIGLSLPNIALFACSTISQTPTRKMVMNAFRVVKGVSSIGANVMLDKAFSGGYFSEAAKGIREDLADFQKNLSPGLQEQITPFLDSLELADQIGKHLQACASMSTLKGKNIPFIYDKDIDRYVKHFNADMAYQIEKAIMQVSAGKSLVIPGGYFKEDGGHAVATAVTKKANNTYTISCFNTGDGAQAGQGIINTISMLFTWSVKTPTFENVPLNLACKQALLIDLIDLKPIAYWQPVYKIRSHLAQTPEVTEVLKNSIALQSWGTCSFDSIMSYLSHDMPPRLFLAFQLFMKLKANRYIQSALPQARAQNLFNPYTLQLLQDNPKETIRSHINLCDQFFMPIASLQNLATADLLKARIRLVHDTIKDLEQQEASYTASFITFGRTGLIEIQDKLKKQREFFGDLRLFLEKSVSAEKAYQLLNFSDDALSTYLLENNVDFLFKNKEEFEELTRIVNQLKEEQ